MDGTVWLWIGFWGMAIGFAALAVVSKKRTEEESNSSVLHTIVPSVAAVFYLLMAMGQGAFPLEGGSRLFYYARYLDWSLTTPLLLLGLCFMALGGLSGRVALVSALLFSDIFMIITGLFAGLSPSGSVAKWLWYVISCGFFGAVFYVLWGPLAALAKARSPEKSTIYRRNALILSVLWLLYPVVFLFGSEGIKTLAVGYELAAFAILDLLAKVGYGFLTVAEHRSITSKR